MKEFDHWFVEERRFDGGWAGVVYIGPYPSPKKSDGATRVFRNPPAPIPMELKNKPIGIVEKFMSQDGEFVTIPNDEILTVIQTWGENHVRSKC